MGINNDRESFAADGQGVMSESLSPAERFVIEEIRLHLDASSATVENFVVRIDSSKGTRYDVRLYSRNMNGVQDVVFVPNPEYSLVDRDTVTFNWSNTNSRTWGLEVIYRA